VIIVQHPDDPAWHLRLKRRLERGPASRIIVRPQGSLKLWGLEYQHAIRVHDHDLARHPAGRAQA
jgi:hypothetical protein